MKNATKSSFNKLAALIACVALAIGLMSTAAVAEAAEFSLTITANPQTYTYNGQIQGEGDTTYNDPATIAAKVSVVGLQSGHRLSSIQIDGQGNVARGYPLTAKSARVVDGQGQNVTDNYDISYVDGTLTIEPAKATITVDSASKVQGQSDPTFTGKVEGLLSESDLGAVTFIRDGNSEAPGTYKGALTAKYTPNPNYDVALKKGDFTIRAILAMKWLDGDGSVLQENTYIEGEPVPTYKGKEPTKAATAQYTYAFSGWDGGTVEGATTTYRPRFDTTVNKYDIAFDLAGGTLDGQTGTIVWTCEYGSTINLPKPAREGYVFQYWEGSRYDAGDEYIVEGEHAFTAVWKAQSKSSGASKGSAVPKAGDDAALPMALCAIVAFASLMVLVGCAALRRRGDVL